jgi:hypothetical protein
LRSWPIVARGGDRRVSEAPLLDWQLAEGSGCFRGYGDTHDTATLEIEGDGDGLPIETIELSDGIAGGGVEAEGEHGQISVGNTTQEEAG